MTHEQISKAELFDSILVLNTEKSKVSSIEKITSLLDLINELLQFCLTDLIRDGKVKVRLIDIPKVWKAAKQFVNGLLQIWPQDQILRKLELAPLTVGDVLVSYLMWCFQNIIKDNKVKISLIDAIPFIIRTIKMIKEITAVFKASGLIKL